MKKDFALPIQAIGENNWKEKLQQYLDSCDIETAEVDPNSIEEKERELNIKLPKDMREFYVNFGRVDSSDFMYGLKSIEELKFLFAANITFISLNFKMYQINTMVYFADSPGNDPVCFDKDSHEIYLFSHDPIKKALVFSDFNQYLLFELMETEKLVGNGVDETVEQKLKIKLLSGEGIDYEFRDMKL
ncbi:SMI1/KNR4 family protein [Hymenobacter norwichensis]|uniref:SMI1/KNR4 family protein n=1 Tax=Hymenobacter norwichensis TaxID=223903 RepID=UPI0003B35946|nr:SMI1/KNR4 family protein [Hymenobacter norwichensis]